MAIFLWPYNCGTIKTLLFFDWQTGTFLINHTLLFTCLDCSVRNKKNCFLLQKIRFCCIIYQINAALVGPLLKSLKNLINPKMLNCRLGSLFVYLGCTPRQMYVLRDS